MPKQTSSVSVKSLSGRWHLTCRTALFLALASAPIFLPQSAPAQDFANSPPGSFMSSTQKNSNPKVIETPVSQSQTVQAPNDLSQNFQGQNLQSQTQQSQTTSSQGQPYTGQAFNQQQNNYPNASFQGSAVVGVTGSQQSQTMPTCQTNTQRPDQALMAPSPPIQSQIMTTHGSAAQSNNNPPSDFPTLDELKQSFAQNAAGATQTGQATQNVQTAQGQTNTNQKNQGHSTAGGVGSSLLKAIGTVAIPMAVGATMAARPMGMGMGMTGMGMGMPGMGMGMPGMGMGMNPFASPQQMMMNSLINQGLYNGARMLNNH